MTNIYLYSIKQKRYGKGYHNIKKWFKKHPELDFDLKDLTNFIQVNVKKKINDPVNDPLNDRHRMIITLINKNKYITRKQLSEKCKVSVETINRDIRKLRQLDFIKRIGPDKGGYWEVIK